MASKRLLASIGAVLAIGTLSAPTASARYFFNFPSPVTPIAHEVLFIHDLFLAIITVIFAGAISVLFYSLFTHRKSKNYTPATFTKPTTKKQWAWSFVPVLTLIFIDYVVLGIPALHSILALANTRDDKLVVVVTASQWKWHYAYPAYGIQFTSTLSTPMDEVYGNAPKDRHFLLEVDHPLVLPTNEKVLIVLKSADVIHSFWVPAFGIKQDAVPGYLRKTWVNIQKPGVYRGQCAELCGVGHAFMPIVVDARTPAAFTRWVASERAAAGVAREAAEKVWTKEALMANGKRVFDSNCAACHQPNGLGIPGTFPPIATEHPFSASKEMLSDLMKRGFYRAGRITEGPIASHIEIVMHGIPGTPMPAFESQLSDTDIASVITFERNAFGNHTGQVVQPASIKALRSKKVR
ncbi:MAG: cytochrome c oxidase subunit II [Chromatiales bacterium 21-64-14]|nr:MAG: cytochrome c oxidase subunit II [Chromatiales bacterium 21-64-14]HQU17181.1 cytochrome c oxidase subunit II [Gammaproteobacteria bacterium]